MRRQLCSVLIIFTIFGVTSTWAISTAKKVTKTEDAVLIEKTAKDALPSPIPSPSPSTWSVSESEFVASPSDDTDTEFSSRLGTITKNNATSKKELLDTGLKKASTKYKTRNKKSSAAVAASFKSSQVAYPESESVKNPPSGESEGKGQGHEDGPQSDVQLELLDDKEGREVPPDSFDEGKYPRIYYGEADPPQHPPYISAEDEEGGGGGHLGKNHESGNGDHPPKYFYPKNYVQNKHSHKRNKNKKKYEYKYAEDVKRLEDPYRLNQGQNHGDESPPTQQTPDSQYHGPNHYLGKENEEGFEQENQGGGGSGGGPSEFGYGQSHHGGSGPSHYGGYHGRDAAEIISKALHLLIPSALILTGLSAVFPNRIHVPTNDRYYSNNNNLHRHKRSIDYTGQTNEMFEPEHRSISSEEIPYPAAPYKSYNFEIGSPRGKYGQSAQASQPYVFKDFQEIPTSAEEVPSVYNYRTKQSGDHGRKTSGFIRNISNKELQMMISRGPQNPEAFDQYHYSHGGQSATDLDSSFAPSISTPTVIAPPDSLNSVDYSPPQRPKRKMRTRTAIKVRQPKRKRSRPLPPPTQGPITNVNDFQSKLIGSEKIPNTRLMMARSSFKHQDKIDEQHAKGDFRLGDAYLKSMVEQHETEKAASKQVDLSPDGAVMGLITSYAQHDSDSPVCQKKALCELAIKGKNPNATKFETFLWSLASLVPEQFSKLYELDDIFKAVQSGSCEAFHCSSPNLDLQV